jgi:TetR/AcrR family transcriptional regulator
MTLEAPRKSRVRREQQRAIESKHAILNAALVEFANLGFDGASTRGIAKRGSVNHRLINHYFGSKEGLWKATAEHVFALYTERLRRRQRGLEGVDEPVLLRLMLREFILFSAEYPSFHRFMMQANQGDAARLDWLVDRFLRPGGKAEVALLVRAQKAGLFEHGDPMHLRYLFIGAATSVFAFSREFRRITETDPFSTEFVEKHVDTVLELFLQSSTDSAGPNGASAQEV